MSILDGNKTSQRDIQAETVSGRDTNISNNYYSAPIIYREDEVLKGLLVEHELEKEKDPCYRQFSEELNKFFQYSLYAKKRDLEEKLFDGDRAYLIEIALESKEKITKKIQRFSHYQSAQEIYTYLLANIKTAFLHEVSSKIKSKRFKHHQIDDIIDEKIIGPFLHNLNGSSLNIDKHELYGLLYFLTGNCYIEWD